MIEEYLMQYGVLGLWTASLISERFFFQKGIVKALNDLTIAIKTKIK